MPIRATYIEHRPKRKIPNPEPGTRKGISAVVCGPAGILFGVLLTHLLFVFSVILGVIDTYILIMVAEEDTFFENVGALALFATGLLWGIAWLRSGRPGNRATHTVIKRLSYVALALVFLFGAGEEISWGQRILGIATPEAIQEINVADEINIHNVSVLGISMFSLTRRVFNVFWFVFVVFVPVVCAISESVSVKLKRLIPVFPPWIGIPFLLNYVLLRGSLFWTAQLGRQSFDTALSEISETNIAVLFLAAVLYIHLVELRARPREVVDGAS
jgi:hypothetical protein